MSATNRGGARIAHDVYPTPAWCVHRFLEACPLPGGLWIDPCAGDGAIIRAAVQKQGVDWMACEIREECRGPLQASIGREPIIASYLDCDLSGADVIITNPPYALAFDFLTKAIKEASIVVFLLRLNFLGSEERAPWLAENMPDVYVLPNRPSFAASLKCDGGGAYGDGSARNEACGWSVIQQLDAPRATYCPDCGGGVRCSTSDATEYAWMVWGQREDRRGPGLLSVLAPTPKSIRLAR